MSCAVFIEYSCKCIYNIYTLHHTLNLGLILSVINDFRTVWSNPSVSQANGKSQLSWLCIPSDITQHWIYVCDGCLILSEYVRVLMENDSVIYGMNKEQYFNRAKIIEQHNSNNKN